MFKTTDVYLTSKLENHSTSHRLKIRYNDSIIRYRNIPKSLRPRFDLSEHSSEQEDEDIDLIEQESDDTRNNRISNLMQSKLSELIQMVINQHRVPIPHDTFNAYMGEDFENCSDDIEDILSDLQRQGILDWNDEEIFKL